MTDYENNEEIKIFREYLRIPTVHPDIDYGNILYSIIQLLSHPLNDSCTFIVHSLIITTFYCNYYFAIFN